jgi:hypothetical protein
MRGAAAAAAPHAPIIIRVAIHLIAPTLGESSPKNEGPRAATNRLSLALLYFPYPSGSVLSDLAP